MVVPFQELRKHEFSLSGINVMCQRPLYRMLTQKSRVTNSFLYLQQGSFRYSFEEGDFTASEGGVVYLPLGSRHRLDSLSKEICFYRIDFTIRIDGEIALFSISIRAIIVKRFCISFCEMSRILMFFS